MINRYCGRDDDFNFNWDYPKICLMCKRFPCSKHSCLQSMELWESREKLCDRLNCLNRNFQCETFWAKTFLRTGPSAEARDDPTRLVGILLHPHTTPLVHCPCCEYNPRGPSRTTITWLMRGIIIGGGLACCHRALTPTLALCSYFKASHSDCSMLQEIMNVKFLEMEEGRKIENKNFREPLINASGETPGNNLGSNWPKQSRKWEKIHPRHQKLFCFQPLCRSPRISRPCLHPAGIRCALGSKSRPRRAEPGGVIMDQDQRGIFRGEIRLQSWSLCHRGVHTNKNMLWLLTFWSNNLFFAHELKTLCFT